MFESCLSEVYRDSFGRIRAAVGHYPGALDSARRMRDAEQGAGPIAEIAVLRSPDRTR